MASTFGLFQVPAPYNEPVRSYAPGSPERESLAQTLQAMQAQEIKIPMIIGGREVFTNEQINIVQPHKRKHILGSFSRGTETHVAEAIQEALQAKQAWESMHWENRAAIFLKAAELIAGPYRNKLNAATMLGQSKNVYQAEIDSACEIIDFLRYNVFYMTEIYSEQPVSAPGIWNRMEQRPLEGFVFALTPFNFTAIAGNLPTSAAMMGNVVVWKPADTQIYAAHVLMEIFREAGLPPGVINLVFVSGPAAGKVIFSHPEFAGIHFTGSTGVFKQIWKTIGENIEIYRSYPRIVGETGGKDFIIAHPSADPLVVATAISRGAFEYQGQKCSAASRCYIAASIWPQVREKLISDLASFKIGPVDDFSNFINAVIDEKSFDKLVSYIEQVRRDPDTEIIAGGTYDKSEGFFISPTVILTKNPGSVTMCDELFGPVVTIYVYNDHAFEETLALINNTSGYALTGAIIARDRQAIELASVKLRDAAGNFYVNDKPTGAVVGQQPFGGARGSGTNDKAGSKINLMRWVSPRVIKETFVPPTDYRYPFMD